MDLVPVYVYYDETNLFFLRLPADEPLRNHLPVLTEAHIPDDLFTPCPLRFYYEDGKKVNLNMLAHHLENDLWLYLDPYVARKTARLLKKFGLSHPERLVNEMYTVNIKYVDAAGNEINWEITEHGRMTVEALKEIVRERHQIPESTPLYVYRTDGRTSYQVQGRCFWHIFLGMTEFGFLISHRKMTRRTVPNAPTEPPAEHDDAEHADDEAPPAAPTGPVEYVEYTDTDVQETNEIVRRVAQEAAAAQQEGEVDSDDNFCIENVIENKAPEDAKSEELKRVVERMLLNGTLKDYDFVIFRETRRIEMDTRGWYDDFLQFAVTLKVERAAITYDDDDAEEETESEEEALPADQILLKVDLLNGAGPKEIAFLRADTVTAVRNKLVEYAKLARNKKNYVLFFNGWLDGNAVISEVTGIENGTVLLIDKDTQHGGDVEDGGDDAFYVSVKTPFGTTQFLVESTQTVRELKFQIFGKLGHRPQEQRLYFNKMDMNKDTKELWEFHLCANDVLDLNLKLGGSGPKGGAKKPRTSSKPPRALPEPEQEADAGDENEDDVEMDDDNTEKGAAGNLKRAQQQVKVHVRYIDGIQNDDLVSPDEVKAETKRLEECVKNLIDHKRPHEFEGFLSAAELQDLKSLRSQYQTLQSGRNKTNNQRWLAKTLLGKITRKLEETDTVAKKLKEITVHTVAAAYVDKYNHYAMTDAFKDDLDTVITNKEKDAAVRAAVAAAAAAAPAAPSDPRRGVLGFLPGTR